MSEGDEYEADAALVGRSLERFDRLYAQLDDLHAQWAMLNVEAEGGEGDVVLSLNFKGQLTALSLAEGCTVRYTHLALEELLNTTLREAAKAVVTESGAIDDAAAAAAVQAMEVLHNTAD
jgi:hypothetical protein